MYQFLGETLIGLVLLSVGFFAGRFAERRHLRDLERREELVKDMLLTNSRQFPAGAQGDAGATLLCTECCISSDYFKTFIAWIVSFIGGELRTLQTLMDRARREATLRLLEEARELGYDAVCNVRLNTMDISSAERKRAFVMAIVIASGTAYKRSEASVGSPVLV